MIIIILNYVLSVKKPCCSSGLTYDMIHRGLQLYGEGKPSKEICTASKENQWRVRKSQPAQGNYGRSPLILR